MHELTALSVTYLYIIAHTLSDAIVTELLILCEVIVKVQVYQLLC